MNKKLIKISKHVFVNKISHINEGKEGVITKQLGEDLWEVKHQDCIGEYSSEELEPECMIYWYLYKRWIRLAQDISA